MKLFEADHGNGVVPSMFSVELRVDGSTCVLVMGGELRSTSIVALELQIDQLGCLAFEDVVVDASGLSSVDAIGADALTGLHHYVRAREAHMVVIGAGPQVARDLAATPLNVRRTTLMVPGNG